MLYVTIQSNFYNLYYILCIVSKNLVSSVCLFFFCKVSFLWLLYIEVIVTFLFSSSYCFNSVEFWAIHVLLYLLLVIASYWEEWLVLLKLIINIICFCFQFFCEKLSKGSTGDKIIIYIYIIWLFGQQQNKLR